MPRESDDPLIGRVLAGRYRVEALIDRGGMGRVYRAIQLPIGRPVALKTLDLSDPRGEFKARFENEAAVQGRLTHPNTVRMFDYGRTDDGLYYITMELLEGESLNTVIKRDAPLDPLRVIHIARQICNALHEAHELGVVHRDLKPGNVFLTEHGNDRDHVKILDFGLVKDLEDNQDLSHTGQTLGSPMYMSPEQVEGDPVDRRTDIYALGLVMWVAITGKLPYPRGSVATIMLHQVSTEVPAFAAVNAGLKVPPDLEAVIQRCVSKAKPGRPESMAVLERELGAIERRLKGEPEPSAVSSQSATVPMPTPAVVEPPPRQTSLLGMAALGASIVVLLAAILLAVVGLGGGGVAVWALLRGTPQAPPAPSPTPEQVEEAYSRITGVLKCTEVVLKAPSRGLLRGRVVSTGTPRVGLRGPEARMDQTTVSANDAGRVEIGIPAGEPGAPVEFEVVCPGLVSLVTDRADVDVDTVRGKAFSILSGNGNVTLEGAVVQELGVVVRESGDVDLGLVAAGSLDVELMGSGDLTGRGSANQVRITQRASGDTTLEGLTASTVVVELYGSGDSEVTATKSLIARTENSGDITYGGAPPDVDSRALGSGKVQPKK